MKSPGLAGKTVVVVGTITDDARIFEVPALKVRQISIIP
jgi:ribosomal protein L18E